MHLKHMHAIISTFKCVYYVRECMAIYSGKKNKVELTKLLMNAKNNIDRTNKQQGSLRKIGTTRKPIVTIRDG